MENFNWKKSQGEEMPEHSSRATPLDMISGFRDPFKGDPKRQNARDTATHHVWEENKKNNKTIVSGVELPVHSSRAMKLNKSELLINNYSVQEEAKDVHLERDVLEKKKALVEAQLMEAYSKSGNRTETKRLEGILDDIDTKLKIVRESTDEKKEGQIKGDQGSVELSHEMVKGDDGIWKIKTEIPHRGEELEENATKIEDTEKTEKVEKERLKDLQSPEYTQGGKEATARLNEMLGDMGVIVTNSKDSSPATSKVDSHEYVSVNKGVVKQVNPKLINVSMKDFEETPADRNSAEKRVVKELDDAREKFAFADEGKDPQEYVRISEEYRLKVEKEKDFIIHHKKLTLEKKGLTPEQVQLELDKYTKEVIAPHFAVVEAAKIQEARTEPSFIEKMKDSKWGSFAGKVIDGYRKMPWQKKLLVSAGLFGAGVTVGAVGGTGLFVAVGIIITGGKGIQRLLSGAGTAVGIDALIQKHQQEWMLKEGWGKNRHEYISKQVALMSEKMKRGDVADKDIEERLKEREEIEKDNEIRRTGIAATAGVLVGSGAAFRVADEYLGISDKLRVAGDYFGVSDKLKHLFGGEIKVPTEHHTVATGAPPVAETIAPVNIKPIELSISTRGPEGAIIDELRRNPELARKLGWTGNSDEDFSKWVGAKAHILWGESAKQALLDPSVKQELAKLGYPETAEGYEKAMTRIGKGIVSLDIDKGSIKLDAEYLKNIKTIISPSPEVSSLRPSLSVESPMSDMSRPSVSLEEVDFVGIQRQMDLPEGKLRELFVTSGVSEKGFEDLLKNEGGIEKLLKMPVRDLYGIEQGYPRPVQLDRLYEGLKGITGEARLDSNDTLEDVLKSIKSKDIFHGTAEEILKGETPPHLEINSPSHLGITHAVETPTSASSDIPHEELAKSSELKTSDITKEIGQVSSNEVVTGTGVKGVFNYDANGKIVNMGIKGSESILKGRALLNDNYHEIITKKGGNIAHFRTVDILVQQIYQEQQILKTLEGSGQGSGDKADFLRKTIKGATEQIENNYGKVFK